MVRFWVLFMVLCEQPWYPHAIRNRIDSYSRIHHICNLRRPIISALIGCSLMQSSPVFALGLSSLPGIARASESVDYILANLDNKDIEVNKLFDEVDIIIKRFYLRDRLQLAIAETPAQYR